MKLVYQRAVHHIFICLIFCIWLPGILLVVSAQEEGGEEAEVQFPAGVDPADDAHDAAGVEVDLVHKEENVLASENERETEVCALSERSNTEHFVLDVHLRQPMQPPKSVTSCTC